RDPLRLADYLGHMRSGNNYYKRMTFYLVIVVQCCASFALVNRQKQFSYS
ncbi:MAG: hypothetical protein RL585_2349, partial [Pseudomonadota bacterium]